ncbi:MAG: type II toxin-antitoxin system HicB family antitoxin [Candidatus Wildermuthbacteria bacterium]|nr:type II toxin-antitoxin system HicB family antitoxin [Candidatus Wildermuthbacteria bacterium]
MKIYTFRVIIEPDEKNTFHGFVPSLSGCHTWGNTIEKTKKNLKEAIQVYVASLIADKQAVPKETGFEFFTTVSEKELEKVK